MRKLLPLLFLMVGCGVEERERPNLNPVVTINGFEHYVNLFQEQARELKQEVVVTDLVIRFKYISIEEDGKIVLGRCYVGGDRPPTIDIDPSRWDTMGMVERQLLLFHEMGHCLLRRDHVEGFVSIMNPYLLSEQAFIDDEDGLLAELFDSARYGSMLREEMDDRLDSDRHSVCDHFSSGIPDRLGNEVGHP